jgi:hypothetical protein
VGKDTAEITKSDLVEAVSAGVTAALQHAQPAGGIEAIAQAINSSIAGTLEKLQGQRQMSSAEYRTRTPWNPEAKKEHERPAFLRKYFQHGHLIQKWHVSDEDIELLDQLEPGRYLNKRVAVDVKESSNGDADSVFVSYPTKEQSDRQENARLFGSFTNLLRKIVEEIRNPPPEPERKRRRRLAEVQ